MSSLKSKVINWIFILLIWCWYFRFHLIKCKYLKEEIIILFTHLYFSVNNGHTINTLFPLSNNLLKENMIDFCVRKTEIKKQFSITHIVKGEKVKLGKELIKTFTYFTNSLRVNLYSSS